MAQTWVSFDEVKAQVSIVDVLQRYGFFDALKQQGAQLVGRCPFHNDSKASFKVTPERNIWHCFGACGRGGDVIDLVCAAEGIATGHRTSNRRQAALLLQDWGGIEAEPSLKKPVQRAKKQTKAVAGARAEDNEAKRGTEEEPEVAPTDKPPANQPLSFTLQNLDANHPYLKVRGLTDETVHAFGLGYHRGKGSMHGRLVIPIHNERGELVAYAGRWPGDPPEGEPKYKLPANFHKSLVLYNVHRAREYATEGLIVVESYFSVFELWQKNRKNVVAVMGSSLSETQERLIVDTVGPRGRVLIAFDPDEAGRRGMDAAAARLAPQVFVRTAALSI